MEEDEWKRMKLKRRDGRRCMEEYEIEEKGMRMNGRV
jgi:hypothetical protein